MNPIRKGFIDLAKKEYDFAKSIYHAQKHSVKETEAAIEMVEWEMDSQLTCRNAIAIAADHVTLCNRVVAERDKLEELRRNMVAKADEVTRLVCPEHYLMTREVETTGEEVAA